MFTDAGEIASKDRLEADLCIVGAGPAGLTIARAFARRDIRVCVLESGGPRSSVRTHRLTGGPSVGASYHRLLLSRDRAFGGTSVRFPLGEGWHARPLDPIDFESRPNVPNSGWPLDYNDVATYFSRAQELSDLGPYTYDPAAWEGDQHGRRLPLDPNVVETTMFQLGVSNFSRWWDDFARYENVNVILRSTVVDIATDTDPSAVDRLVVARPDGERFSVSARAYVLATGAIDNARLLLASSRTHPRGLGNDYDLVGRYFMERLSTRSGYIEPADAGVVDSTRLYVNHPVDDPHGLRIEGALRLKDDVIRAEGLRNTLFFVLQRSRAFMSEGVRSAGTIVKSYRRQPLPDGFQGHVRNVALGWRDIAQVVREKVQGVARDDRVLLLRAQAEQAPNPDSRVTLDRRRDPLGMPRARLAWRMTADDRASIRRSQELIGDAFRRAGLGQLAVGFGDEDPPAMFEGNWHHLGTTRMANNPRSGVVDRDCRMHAVSNLYVAGSSVFPTEGSSNPTLTIVALSLRLAEHLEDVLGVPGSGRSIERDYGAEAG